MTRRNVGRGPEDEHAELFLDVVETMLDTGGHEDKAPCLHRPVLIRNTDLAPTADHVVHLVLTMRLLVVGRARRPDREPDAELAGGEKIDVAVTLGVTGLWVELRNFVRLHELTIATAGNAGTGG